MGEDTVSANLLSLARASTTEEELQMLQMLNCSLTAYPLNMSTAVSVTDDADTLERQFLSQSRIVLESDNPFPRVMVSDLVFSSDITLNQFVGYVFTRRYGWSEVMPKEGTWEVQRVSGVGVSSLKEASLKPALNELLDEFLKWFLCHPLSHILLTSMKATLLSSHPHPVVRKQAVSHILDWFRHVCPVFPENFFNESLELIILGLTDVWSEIRASCAAKLGGIIERFSLAQLEVFFQRLVTICHSVSQSVNSNEGDSVTTRWQMREGAVIGLNVIIRRFQWVGYQQSEHSTPSILPQSPRTEYYLKFGTTELEKIPIFISQQLREVIFLLLADPQLSIREHATKTFSSYLSRCEFNEVLMSFKEVITVLGKGTGVDSTAYMASSMLLDAGYKWIDAYLAEGLLSLCIFLVKHIPPGFLLPSWPLYFSTFSHYLMHPASTVRQATSNIFKFLVAKDANNPAIMKLVLNDLTKLWDANLKALLSKRLPCNTIQDQQHLPLCQLHYQVNNPSITVAQCRQGEVPQWYTETWEWREGRLLAYELILQFLVKNHWLYTFGAAGGKRTQSDNQDIIDVKESGRPRNAFVNGDTSFKSAVGSPSASFTSRPAVKHPDHKENTSSLVKQDSHTEADERLQLNLSALLQEDTSSLRSPSTKRALLRRNVSQHSSKGLPNSLPRMVLRRRATMDHIHAASLRTLVRHYSYYERPSALFRAPGGLGLSARAMPLITAMRELESHQPPVEKSPRIDIDSRLIASPLVPPEGHEVGDVWLLDSSNVTLRSILDRMLLQTIECFDSSSWELRRMSLQVFPYLVELIRWFNMNILTEFWTEYFIGETTLLTYGACLSYLDSLTHAAKLAPLIDDPPENWLDVSACKHEVLLITNGVTESLSRHLETAIVILRRRTFDKLAVLALQIIMTAVSYFSPIIPASLHYCCVTEAVECFKAVISASGTSSRLRKWMMSSEDRLLLPSDGFLRCHITSSDSPQDLAQHLEQCLLAQTETLLVRFLNHANLNCTYKLLPFIANLLCKKNTMDQHLKYLSESTMVLLSGLSTASGEIDVKLINDCKNDCMVELLMVISDKKSSTHCLRYVLDIISTLIRQADGGRFIIPVLRAITSHGSSDSRSVRCEQNPDNGLEIMSNDIREGVTLSVSEDTDSDEEEGVLIGSGHQESMTLLSSTGSGSALSGRHSALSQRSAADSIAVSGSSADVDSDSSDWDSWDEGDKESSNTRDLMTEFFSKLQHDLISQGRKDQFSQCIEKLPRDQIKLLKIYM